MQLYVSTMTLDGVGLKGENPLPQFGDPVQDRPVTHDGTFASEDERLFGFRTGKKILPYSMQDRYDRSQSPQIVKTIILENENLRAVFLPEYGARLYSLYDKQNDGELLYKNEMLQFANLSQRNAWFSGGVEFNFGHYGHTALTCSPLFAAEIEGPEYKILRFYEYERVTRAFYRLDFHLPDGATTLDMFVRLETAGERDTSTYWWTNIAARQTDGCRVFSGTDRVLFDLPRPPGAPDDVPCFAAGRMPQIKVFDGDASYPAKIGHSCEIFFQNQKDADLWEAIGYEDGSLFFEASTQPLRYRKIFCWGNHAGGRRWQRFLNAPADSEYVEIQAGLAPTQLHGMILKSGTPVEFTQSFGRCGVPDGCLDLEWQHAAKTVGEAVREALPAGLLRERHERYRKMAQLSVEKLFHSGSGWGALECARLINDGARLPKGMYFPFASLGAAQLPWLSLLENGIMPDRDQHMPDEWMTGDEWKKLLETSLKLPGGPNAKSLLHLGVMYMEAGEPERARELWERSNGIQPSAVAWRNLSQFYLRAGDVRKALSCIEKALLLPGSDDPAYSEEYLSLLIKAEQYQSAWGHFNSLDPSRRSDRAAITVCKAALELGEDDYLKDFFQTEHAVVREGEYVLTDAWFAWQARLSGEDEADVRLKAKIPEDIDFRMFTTLGTHPR